jgi:hypothetical protein
MREINYVEMVSLGKGKNRIYEREVHEVGHRDSLCLSLCLSVFLPGFCFSLSTWSMGEQISQIAGRLCG